MSNYKKIPKDDRIDGKYVYVKVDGSPCKEIYEACFHDGEYSFIDNNEVFCREWNGEPTHYKLVNS